MSLLCDVLLWFQVVACFLFFVVRCCIFYISKSKHAAKKANRACDSRVMSIILPHGIFATQKIPLYYFLLVCSSSSSSSSSPSIIIIDVT
jgi:hypothetical protein